MDRSGRPAFHPLLLQRSYWRNRLQTLRLARPSLLILPRPDLSTPFLEVEEFRARSHDGIRLWGLKARCHMRAEPGPVRVRMVGPCDLPVVDGAVLDEGVIEYVFQTPAGRRLEDRVLDVVRVAQIAAEHEGIELRRVELHVPAEDARPDEMQIAARILEEKLDG
jgi:hypothetical protein